MLAGVFRSAISLVVLVVEGTRGIDYLFGVILSVVMANFVAHHIHHDGVYESELERIGNVYMLRDEPPHRLFTLTAEAIMATGVVGFRCASRRVPWTCTKRHDSNQRHACLRKGGGIDLQWGRSLPGSG